MKYDYEGPFLQQWPPPRRSLIANQFCYAVRKGAKTANEVLRLVGADAQERFAPYGDGTLEGDSQRILLAVIDDEETRKFAEFILWRESLPYSVKDKLKEEARKNHRTAWMSSHPPTQPQLKYLEGLACHIVPSNMLEASELIEKYKNGNVPRS